MEKVTVLGSTGSIGTSTLDVIRRNHDKFAVFALGAGRDVQSMFRQCCEFKPRFAALADENAANELAKEIKNAGLSTEVLCGSASLAAIASDPEADSVMAAVAGIAGLESSLAAAKSGKRVYLANKEALVMTGHLFIEAAKESGACILPVDSEHNAIFQSLPESEQRAIGFCDMKRAGIRKVLLTGSGGPFRTTDPKTLSDVTPEQAVAHPNWSMGKKISVDSATMMNKGFEYIEAKWLFNLDPSEIEVIVHPESVIHSMVQYVDGSVIAELGNPDMRTPIARAMSYPDRVESGVTDLDFFSLSGLHFLKPDLERYPCLKLAYEACASGQAATTAITAADEIAVHAFLNRQIGFLDIAGIAAEAMDKFAGEPVGSLDEVRELNARVIEWAKKRVAAR